ncbi:MAG: hypothetical protein ACFCUW_18135 [Kiloniellaceae bacterium]
MGERGRRSPKPFHALVELALVGGASLVAIFWIIPSQTVPASAFGLSPSMLPIACAIAIAILALLQCVGSLLRRSATPDADRAAGERPTMIHALVIVAAALVGTFVLAQFGILASGVVLALLVSISIGERRLLRNAMLCCAVAVVMLLIDLSGI